MKVGDHVVTPEGAGELVKGVAYVYLGGSAGSPHITFVHFLGERPNSSGRRIHVLRMQRPDFERRLTKQLIILAPEQPALPPWLACIDGAGLEEIEHLRCHQPLGGERSHKPVGKNADICAARFQAIATLVERLDEVLSASNPFSIINAYAKAGPKQRNRTRLAEWFFAYIAFGRNLMALYPEFPNAGRWDRAEEKYTDAPLGRPSLSKGRQFGWPSAMFSEQIKEAFEKYAKKGMTLMGVYRRHLEELGCRARLGPDGSYEMFHPEGRAFPETYGKFRFQVHKHFTQQEIDTALLGAERVRNHVSASKGSYAEELANAMEKVEIDGYYLAVKPVGVEGDIMPGLCVVRAVCISTKAVIGVGFALNKEKESAYRAMLFSMAVGLQRMAELFGIRDKVLDCLITGVAPHLISDRGSAPLAAVLNNPNVDFPVKEVVQPYTPRSKPSVESANPRKVKTEGAPFHRVADMLPIQLAQGELSKAIQENHTSFVGPLASGCRAEEGVLPTPFGLFSYLDGRGRNDGIRIAEADAARKFLTPVEVELRDGGVWYLYRRFSSTEFVRSPMLERVGRGQRVKLRGYVLEMCLARIWVEWENKCLCLNFVGAYQDAETEAYQTLIGVEGQQKAAAVARSAQRQSAVAAAVEAAALREEAGISEDSIKMVSGRLKKPGPVARAGAQGLNSHGKGRAA
jgi:hypothetical protein